MTRPLATFLSAIVACAASAATPTPTRAVIPLHFEANQGQTDPRVQFIARAGEHAVYLGRGEAFLALDESSNSTRFVRLSFPGANADAAGTGVEKFAGRVNYLLGNDPAGWHTGIPAYGKVEYPQVYPGVDLVFHGRQQQLEYDFVVAPGANAGAITIRIDGTDRIRLDGQGDLLIQAGAQQFRQHAPKAWQKISGFPIAVPVRYAFKDARTVTFTLGAYDQARELIIDPVISYSTYIGGSGRDRAWTVAMDASGSAYVGGDTQSIFKNLPVSGVQTNRGSSNGDGFVARLNADGSGFDYLTYLGGKDIDAVIAIALDAGNNAYLAGYTTSPNFPITPGAFQRKIKSRSTGGYIVFEADAFLTKLNPAGDALVYSTFYGGQRTDGALGVSVDVDGNALLCGFTQSSDLPTNNAVQPKFKGGFDAFVAKFNATGTALIYGTYLGGVSSEYANGIAVDAEGNAVVTGFTQSASFPTNNAFPTTNAFQPLFGGGRDAFLTKYSPTGTVIFSTYFGGTGLDLGYSVHLDAAGDIYVSGSKSSLDFPTTVGINNGGVFSSANAGTNWMLKSTGLTHNHIQALAASEAQPFRAFAGTLRGVFATTNGGGTWVPRNHDLESQNVTAIALDPGDPDLIYLGTASTVQKSTNGGLHWTTNDAGLTAGNIRALVLQPGLSSTLYAGSFNGGVYVSSNSAASWTRIVSGLGNLFVNALAVDPATPSTLYAATDGGVYKSTNSGAKWFSQNTGLIPSRRTQAFLLDPTSPATLYAGTSQGLFKSTNGAATWSLIGAGVFGSGVINALARDSATSNLYVGTISSFFRSVDAGATFTTNKTGLTTTHITSLVALPGLVYAGTYGINSFGGTNDAFLTKFSADGSNILYSVVLGGSKGDEGFSAAVAADGSVVFAGSTASTNFPVVDPPSVIQSTNSGKSRSSDAWVAQINPSGTSLVYSFYLGGKGNDFGEAVAVDSSGNAYVAGFTSSTNFPTVGPVQAKLAGSSDAFVTKVAAASSSLLVETTSEYVIARWPASATTFHLETSENSAGSWRPVTEAPATRGDWNIVVLPAANAGPFFRLRRP